MILEFNGDKPQIHSSAYVASTAAATGKVFLEENSCLLFGVSARGDVNYIKVGKNSNVQDNTTLHVGYDYPCIIGENCVIGHNAVVHGAQLEDSVLVGIGAILLNGVKIGKNSIIAAGSLVPENTVIPENSVVMGSPAKIKRKITDKEIKMINDIAAGYTKIMKQYKNQETNV